MHFNNEYLRRRKSNDRLFYLVLISELIKLYIVLELKSQVNKIVSFTTVLKNLIIYENFDSAAKKKNKKKKKSSYEGKSRYIIPEFYHLCTFKYIQESIFYLIYV